MSENTRHTVSESADKIVLKTKIKRGEGTRDEDRIEVKVKGDDPEETAQKLHDTVVAIGSQNTVNALRGTQPSSDE
jgi:major membrane immunogen (membrane-anchored lipoprotein)